MKTIAEALAELKINKPNGKTYVADWKKQIPEWSLWYPGSPGKPDCESCRGLGVLRVDVAHYTHPFFGKLFACECSASAGTALAPRARSIERVRKDLE